MLKLRSVDSHLSDVRKSIAIKMVGLVVIGLTVSLLPTLTGSSAAFDTREVEPQSRRTSKRVKGAASKKPRVDYSRFSHPTHVNQAKLTCDACHVFPTKNWQEVRKGDAAFQDVAEFPEHSACLNCHRTQFFARERPAPVVCSNCHVKVTPRDTTRFLFPSLGDVQDSSRPSRDFVPEFAINFPHDKHVEIVGAFTQRNRSGFISVSLRSSTSSRVADDAPKSCPVCHQTLQPQGTSDEEYIVTPPKDLGDKFWLKKGTFKSSPRSHTVCFTCHNKEAEVPPLPSDCGACHKLETTGQQLKPDFDRKIAAPMVGANKLDLAIWSRRISSGTFRHEGGEHPNLSCLNCHNVATMNTLDKKSLVVATKSCGGAEGCHITATSDEGGILNFEIDQRKEKSDFVCSKCHIIFGSSPVPASHLQSIQLLKKP